MTGVHRRILGLSTGWWVRLSVSCVLGGFLLYLVDREVEVVPPSLDAPLAPLLLFGASLLLYFFLRAGRWWFLVRAVGPIGFVDALLVALAGILWTVALPFRLGEFARPYLAYRRTRIPMETVLGTVAVERIADGFVVCGLFFSVMGTTPPQGPLSVVYGHALVVMGLFGVALAGAFALARRPEQVSAWIDHAFGRRWPGVADRAARFVRGLSHGLTVLPSGRPLVPFLILTAAYWVVNVGGLWVLARGFGLSIDLLETGAVVAMLNMVLLVPAGPAMTGSYQAGLAIGLAFFVSADVVKGPGSLLIFWSYVLQMALAFVFGAAAHLLLGISARQVAAAEIPNLSSGD